jgi:hypothetical protein
MTDNSVKSVMPGESVRTWMDDEARQDRAERSAPAAIQQGSGHTAGPPLPGYLLPHDTVPALRSRWAGRGSTTHACRGGEMRAVFMLSAHMRDNWFDFPCMPKP